MLLSIVIVEYHSPDDIRHCTASIAKQVHVPYEVIVSSNSCYSPEEQQRMVSEYAADGNVRWIFNARNGGFAYAMNQGLAVAQGDYLVIMNSDCTIESDLGILVKFLEANPHVGAVAPQIRDAEGNIQDTARPYVSLPRFAWRQMKRVLFHRESVLNPRMDYTQVQTVDWIIGAFIMVTRRAYELTGGLDDDFFMYAEDLDWCTRIRQQGLEVVYYPRALITYKGTRRARQNGKYARIFLKSHNRYWKKFGYVFGYPKRRKQEWQ